MLSVDDLLKILLVFSICFSLVGIAVQIMRLLGTTNSIMQDCRKLIDSVKGDYDEIMDKVNRILDIVDPIYDLVYGALDKVKSVLGLLKK